MQVRRRVLFDGGVYRGRAYFISRVFCALESSVGRSLPRRPSLADVEGVALGIDD